MKLQINTTEKTIKIEEQVNISELFDMLTKLFPNDEWKSYKLESAVITQWVNPITIPYPVYPSPYWWNPNPMITFCNDTVTDCEYNGSFSGTTVNVPSVFNLEIAN